METSRLYEWGAGMRRSSFWSTRVLSLYHLLQNKKRITVMHTQHSTHANVYAHTRGSRVRSSLWLT